MRPDRFRRFVAIDWSGAKGPRQKGIALAQCETGEAAPRLLSEGHVWSRTEVLEWLTSELPADTLVGLDLSPGLPFADEFAYFPGWDASPPDAKALWRKIDELAAEDDHLAVTSVLAHPEVRRHFRHRKGDCGDCFPKGLGRLRETERRQRSSHELSPSSCFNLVGAAQVGKSSLTGMRVLHRLNGALPVWPFDPLPDHGSVVVEIYTSLAARQANIKTGRSKMRTAEQLDKALGEWGVQPHEPLTSTHYSDHATDAILTAAWLRQSANRAELWQPAGLTRQIAQTEGWTFGVT